VGLYFGEKRKARKNNSARCVEFSSRKGIKIKTGNATDNNAFNQTEDNAGAFFILAFVDPLVKAIVGHCNLL
jgi:hypothetical protein